MAVCLALDWSTSRLSVAVKRGEDIISETLQTHRFQVAEALQIVEQVLYSAGVRAGEVEEIRVGRGPGNTTGIRQSLAAAIGISSPGNLPLRAVSSGTLIASGPEWREKQGWILGDARRGMWWGASFPAAPLQWELKTPEDWKEEVAGSLVLSSEASRLTGIEAVEAFPSAEVLLQLELEQLQDPAEPLYLHPAV